MTTRHGGFYINTGKLDFRYCSDLDSDDDVTAVPRMKKKKKVGYHHPPMLVQNLAQT